MVLSWTIGVRRRRFGGAYRQTSSSLSSRLMISRRASGDKLTECDGESIFVGQDGSFSAYLTFDILQQIAQPFSKL